MPLSAIDTRQAIRDWRMRHPDLAIIFSENLRPDNEALNDYVVVYEASFKSASLTKLQLEIFSTADDFVGIGIETRKRVATRLSVKPGRSGYATGHEPGPMASEQLLALLDAAADGRISLLPKVGLLGLGKTTAILSVTAGGAVPNFDTSRHWHWLSVSSREQSTTSESVLLFDRW